ncbi:AlpA family phage regulatory protein [Vreelandella massiliensis]|uniref:helix-turn-helix transcriptional regulator n=1 Tax=Vreelandella massiliensis TaxID=1816686 RepID=UPI00096AA88A
MNNLHEDRYLCDLEVCKRYNISRSTLWRWRSLGRVPPPVRLGPRAVRWSLQTLILWEKAKH